MDQITVFSLIMLLLWTPLMPAQEPPPLEKDAVLEELKMSAQGILTETPEEKNAAAEPSPPAAGKTPPPSTEELKTPQDYFSSPSRVKKEELEKKLNEIISSKPKNEEAYWKLFELYHHYAEWSKDTDFYQNSQPYQILELLQDMRKKFGESQKITKYLCQYFVINHLYTESQPHCEKAKKLLPEDTNLHLFADYLGSAPHDLNQKKKTKILLNLLKTKAPSERLYAAIGSLFFDKKKYTLSVKYFEKAVKMDDSYIPGLLGLAQALTKAGRHDTALKYYVLSCQKHPYRSRAPFQQAKAHLSRKSLFKMAGEYQNQINICINSIKTSGGAYFSFSLTKYHPNREKLRSSLCLKLL